MRRVLALSLLLATACVHAPARRGHATARLLALEVQPSPRGELRLLARYQLDGLPVAVWRGDSARLTLSLDDVPFAVVLAQPTVLPGDALEIPVALTFPRAPREVSGAWSRGAAIRVRLRGEVTVLAPDATEKVPTDAEQAVVLPADALPQSRG